VSGPERAAGAVSVRVELAAARAAEAARLDGAGPAEGVVWIAEVELRGVPAALRELGVRLAEAARLAEQEAGR
jgi:hypothetical protein